MKNKDKTTFTKILAAANKKSGSIFLFLFVLAIITVFLFADRGTLLLYKSNSNKEQLESEIKELEKKRDRLLIEKDRLENDPKYIEKIAREKYQMKKKDEKVYQVEMDKD